MFRTLILSSVTSMLLFSAGDISRADAPAAAPKGIAPKGPLSPEESLKHLVLADPNLQIEIVAAEPEVIDPVAIQFDEHGRLWVVEMRDYPTGPQNAPPPLGGPDAKPLSRIKLLEDKDGDGRFETAHIFADNLLFATGVQPWDGGVIVTLAGEVAYFKDTDGDHKADLRETWFTGFSQQNTQLRANHPTFGPDGWIYIANGLRGGNVIAVKKDWPVKVEGAGVRGQGSEKDKSQSPSHPVTPSPSHTTDGKKTNAQGVSHDPANPVPVSLTGRDFKFDPLTGRYEAISGNGQFGMTFDAWGNRFVCDNRHPCRHVIFEEDFIRRCPHVAFPAVVNDVIPPDDKNKVFPLTSAWTTSNLHAGTFTAACGVCVYTGDWLPVEFRGNVFVCEPTGNLVQRAVLEPDGVTFKSRNPHERSADRSSVAPQPRFPNASPTSTNKPASNSQATSNDESRSWNDRATETQEFLASRDDWFRPVDLQNGPDGALYVVDMYRAVIEHPEWVPDELKNRPDTWLGNDKGRIYRIRPKSSPHVPREDQPSTPSTSADKSASNARSANLTRNVRATLGKPLVSVANLDASFNSPNGWHRTTASRVIHERINRNDGLLQINSSREESSLLLLRSKMLRRIGAASEIIGCFFSKNDHVRAEALGLLNELSDEVESRRASWFFGRYFRDPSALVRFRAMQVIDPSATESKDDAIVDFALQAIEDSGDPWIRQVAVAAAVPQIREIFWIFVESPAESLTAREAQRILLGMLGEQIGIQLGRLSDVDERDEALRHTISMLAESVSQAHFSFLNAADATLGIERGLNRSGQSLAKTDLLFSRPFDDEGIQSLGNHARGVLLKSEVDDIDRALLAARLLRLAPNDETGSRRLKETAELSTDQSLRLVALESFASFKKPEVDAWLLARYSAETPAARRAILSALLASRERQLALLGAIADGQIAATEIDPVRAKQLTESKDEAVREKARQVLAAAAPASRKEVLEAYQPALTLKGDPQRGREVFQKNCVTCHRVGDLGVNVAPDISDTRTKKPEQLLLDILDPNRAIDANYFAYAVVTKDGKAESGVIASESSNSITLKQSEGKTLTLLRSDIDELRNTGLSLMPVGVEKNINPQQMADLIFWLKNWRYLDGKVPATSLK